MLEKDSKEGRGFIFFFTAAAFFALDPIFVKSSPWTNTFAITALRALTSAALCSVFCRQLPKLPDKKLILPYIGWAISVLSLIAAFQLVTASLVLMLFYSSAIWTCILKRVLRGTVPFIDFFTSCFVFVGLVVLLELGRSNELGLGCLLGLLAAIFYSYSFVVLEQYQVETKSPTVYLDALISVQTALGLFCVVASIASGMPIADLQNPYGYFYGILDGGLAYGLPYLLTFRAIKDVQWHTASTTLAGIEPIFVFSFAWAFLDEIPSSQRIVGAIVVVGAICFRGLVLMRKGKRR